jgi:hypothetical protein
MSCKVTRLSACAYVEQSERKKREVVVAACNAGLMVPVIRNPSSDRKVMWSYRS